MPSVWPPAAASAESIVCLVFTYDELGEAHSSSAIAPFLAGVVRTKHIVKTDFMHKEWAHKRH